MAGAEEARTVWTAGESSCGTIGVWVLLRCRYNTDMDIVPGSQLTGVDTCLLLLVGVSLRCAIPPYAGHKQGLLGIGVLRQLVVFGRFRVLLRDIIFGIQWYVSPKGCGTRQDSLLTTCHSPAILAPH